MGTLEDVRGQLFFFSKMVQHHFNFYPNSSSFRATNTAMVTLRTEYIISFQHRLSISLHFAGILISLLVLLLITCIPAHTY
jgi:hypothetical protein